MVGNIVHARSRYHGGINVASQQRQRDPPVPCGGIVDTIHSVVPPAAMSVAEGGELGVGRLAPTMLAVVEHWGRTIAHHFWRETRRVMVRFVCVCVCLCMCVWCVVCGVCVYVCVCV